MESEGDVPKAVAAPAAAPEGAVPAAASPTPPGANGKDSPEGASAGAAPAAASDGPASPERRRDMRVFRPSNVPFDPRRLQLPDDFYAATPSDLQTSMASLSGATRSMNNAPMMTKKMRDAEQAKKMSRFRKVLIRVCFPDRTALQGTFAPASTVRDVIKFVNDALRDPKGVRFCLFVTPPKTVLKDLGATLWSLGLVPAALVNIGIEVGPAESSALLSDEALGMLEDVPPPGAAVFSTTAPPVAAETTGSAAAHASRLPRSGAGGASKKVPKWLGRGKK
jgi:tether containing UBX domain for GLUT4